MTPQTEQLSTDPNQLGTDRIIFRDNADVNLGRAGMPKANDVEARNTNQNANAQQPEECVRASS